MHHKFLLEDLAPLNPNVKVMFGNHALYIDNKIFLTTRSNENDPKDNGIWISTCCDHHESLKAQFPSLTHLQAINVKKWLLLPDSADDFKSTAQKLCHLIKEGDPRIGVVVKQKAIRRL